MPATHKLPKQHIEARFAPSTVTHVTDSKSITVDLIWSTGAQVRRHDWSRDTDYLEELSMEPSAVDLSRLNKGAPLLRDHNQSINSVIGVVERAWLESGEGRATVRFSERDDVSAIVQDVESGILTNISVGYAVSEMERVAPKSDGDLPIYRATKWQPMEISLVAIPADHAAQIRSESTELYPVTIRGEIMTESVKTETTPATTEPVKIDTLALERKAAQGERDRINGIRTFGGSSNASAELIERMINDGIPLQVAKEIMIKDWEDRTAPIGRGDVTIVEDAVDKFRAGAIDSLASRAGLAEDNTRNEFRGFSLVDFARKSLELNGMRSDGMSRMDLVGRAFTHTSSDFGTLLADVANKALLKGYMETEETFQQWTTRGILPDFKAAKRVDLNAFPALAAVAEGAEYTEATIGDRGETIQLATYGRLFTISRQAIINDDLSAFSRIPAKMGRAAIRTVGDLVYAVLTANSAMADGTALFHADHKNLLTGAAISTAAVDAMRVAMAKQKDGGNNATLNIRLANLIVPIALEGAAKVVANSEFEVGAATKNNTTPNSVRGTFGVISDARLDASSAAVWYGAANAASHDTVEVAYLDGNDRPYIEQQTGWSVDGAQFKVRIDAGVKALDFRTLAKNPGA